MIKTSIGWEGAAGNIPSSSHNSKESQVSYAFGIVGTSQLTMADATQSFPRERKKKILGRGPFPLRSFASLQISSLLKNRVF